MASEKENISETEGLILKMQILDKVPAGVMVTDPKGSIIYMNSFAEKIIGVGLEEAAGKEILDILALRGKDLLIATKFFAELKSGKELGPEKLGFAIRDGKDTEMEITAYPLEIEGKKYVLVISIDSSGKIGEKLKSSEELYRTLAEAITDRIYMVGNDWCVKFANDFAMKAHNAKKSENICIGIEMLFPGENSAFMKKGIKQAFENSETIKGEINEKSGDGNRWLDVTITPVKEDSGEASSVMIICHDITKRKIYENRISESEELYRTLTESLEDRIYMVGKDNCVKFANSVAADFHNAKNVENICLGIEMLFPKESADFLKEGIGNAFERGKTTSSELKENRKSSEGWVDITISPVREAGGSIISVLVLCHDITERKKMEEELAEIEKKEKSGRKNLILVLLIPIILAASFFSSMSLAESHDESYDRALEYIDAAENGIYEMEAAGFGIERINDTVSEAKMMLFQGKATGAISLAVYAISIRDSAFAADELIDEAEERMLDAGIKGIDTAYAEQLFQKGIAAFDSEIYEDAEDIFRQTLDEIEKAEAELLARKSAESPGIAELISRNMENIFIFSFASFALGGSIYMASGFWRKRKEINGLKEEKRTIEKALKNLQERYFVEGKSSKSEYDLLAKTHRSRLDEIDKMLIISMEEGRLAKSREKMKTIK